MQNSIAVDRRKSHRKEFQGDLSEIITSLDHNGDFPAAAENISSNGIGIRTTEKLDLNQPVVLKLRGIELTLHVVWSHPSSNKDGTYQTGLTHDGDVDLFSLIEQFEGCRVFHGPHATIA